MLQNCYKSKLLPNFPELRRMPNKYICLGRMFNVFSAIESRDVSLNRTVYDASVDYNSIDKFDILNIYKYLMTNNNIK